MIVGFVILAGVVLVAIVLRALRSYNSWANDQWEWLEEHQGHVISDHIGDFRCFLPNDGRYTCGFSTSSPERAIEDRRFRFENPEGRVVNRPQR